MKEIVEKKKRRLPRILVTLVLVCVVIALVGAGEYLIKYAIGRSGDGGNRTVALEVNPAAEGTEKLLQEGRERAKEEYETFVEVYEPGVETLTIEKDVTISAGYFEAEEPTHRTVILIHGYRGRHEGMYAYAYNYLQEGWNVLMPDLRGCGESGSDYIGMGWTDREDMLSWIDSLVERDAEAEIILHGVSMGGATVMMTSGEETPDQVKAFVEDCGYTSVWDIFKSELGLRFHLPAFPILDVASALAKLQADYSFKEASALEQVKKCEKPMIFFHGSEDNFVPFDMEHVLYEAKPGDNKKEVIAEGAGHGESVYLLGDDYWEDIFEFVEAYM